MKNTMHTHEDRLTNTNRDIERVTCTQREPVDGIDYVENQTRRNNLRIDGVAEVTAETWVDTEDSRPENVRCTLKLPEVQANAIRTRTSAQSGRIEAIGPT
ncbi:hypothetical protein NP493_849g01017 [Ridgeia piscesae]|uniref:Uncharacterized protein n=1 Tax=Ridgeia piscesae TaxID=27915 RepID=A0AAD9NNM4_RIDPI|nr:hypothetical protein NP493_849g01017 [Ridgeia piscesae]